MKKSTHFEEQITHALCQAMGGTPVVGVYRTLRVSDASFYVGKRRYAKPTLAKLPELRQLRDEIARPKRVVAELSLDKHIPSEVVRKKL